MRTAVDAVIAFFVELGMEQHDDTAVVVTPRPSAVPDSWLTGSKFTGFSVVPMRRQEVSAFVDRWFASLQEAQDWSGYRNYAERLRRRPAGRAGQQQPRGEDGGESPPLGPPGSSPTTACTCCCWGSTGRRTSGPCAGRKRSPSGCRTWPRSITTGPVFREVMRSGKVATAETHALKATKRGEYLRPQTVNERVKLWFSAAGLKTDGRPVTSHSLRAGGATDLGMNGTTEEELEDAGRWKKGSPIPRKVYVRPAKDAQHDPFSKVPVHDPAATE